MQTNSLTWQVAAASVCGVSHQRQGMPCQDAHAWEILPSGTIGIAVADGAGSAVHSDRGSSIAVQTAIAVLRDRAEDWLAELDHYSGQADRQQTLDQPVETDQDQVPDRNLDSNFNCNLDRNLDPDLDRKSQPSADLRQQHWACSLFDPVLQALKLEAERENWPLADLATTLIVMVANDRAAIAIQVGDGAAIINYMDNAGGTDHGNNTDHVTEQTIALTTPTNGEYANETTFITSHTARESLQIATWKGNLRHLAVMTDGLQRLALSFPQAVPHQPFFRPLFQFVAQQTDTALAGSKLADFLASPRVTDRADDDLTLFLASQSGSEDLGG